jgi:hypothetical protein
VASTDLLFSAGANPTGSPVEIVFGDDGGGSVGTVTLRAAGRITGLRGHVPVRRLVFARATGRLSGLRGAVPVAYDVNVARPMVNVVQSTAQQARPVRAGTLARYEQAQPLQAVLSALWQNAEQLSALVQVRYEGAKPLQSLLRQGYQQARALAAAPVAQSFEQGQPLRNAVAQQYQQAARVGRVVLQRFEDARRLRNTAAQQYQQAACTAAVVLAGFRDAKQLARAVAGRYEEARKPPPGITPRPVQPQPDPCYVPSLPADLVFEELHDPSLPRGLVFVCERHDPGPEPGQPQFVIPLLRVYMTVHTIDAVLLPGMERLPLKGITVSSDDDGFGWNLTASGPADPLLDMLSPVNGGPKQVKVSIDGIDFVFAVEQPERSRRFLEHAVQVRGSSVTALLGAPHVAESAWSTSVTMTAQQIILQALQFTGVDLDWRIDDWLVPTAAWSHRGTPLSVAQRVAEAAGAVLRSHRTLPTLQVAPRFPRVPWEWGAATPNVVMPGQIITTDSLQSTAGVEFNAVYVSGSVQGAIVGHVVRTGTIGDVLAPEVSDRLVTDVVSARQRGISVLSAAALKRRQTMTVPLLTGGTNPGLILPGYLIQVQEPGETWRGLVRGITVTTGVPTVRQQLVVERAG